MIGYDSTEIQRDCAGQGAGLQVLLRYVRRAGNPSRSFRRGLHHLRGMPG